MPEVLVNGVKTYFEVHGEGTPLLFIHGGNLHPVDRTSPGIKGRLPRAVAALAEEPVQIVHYHRRSYGSSELVLSRYTMADLAEDARSLLDHLRVDRAVTVGHSLGGPVALELSRRHPGRVQALCLADSPIRLWEHDEAVRLARRAGDRAAFEAAKEGLRNPAPLELPADAPPAAAEWARTWHEDLLERLALISDEALFRYFVADLREKEAFSSYAPTPAELSMPVLVIYGTDDRPDIVSGAEELRRLLPQAELQAINGAGHGTIQVHSGAIQILRGWVRSVAAGR